MISVWIITNEIVPWRCRRARFQKCTYASPKIRRRSSGLEGGFFVPEIHPGIPERVASVITRTVLTVSPASCTRRIRGRDARNGLREFD